jgi:hypothetical protein
MKKSLLLVLALTAICAFALVFTSSCASSQPPPKVEKSEFDGAPKWVTQGCSAYWGEKKGEKKICGVGSATGTRNISLARTAAQGRARTEIARSLQVQVQSMLKDYQATTTGGQEFGKSASDEQHIVDVSKQITDTTLAGTEQVDTWISPNGTMWVLVALDVEGFKGAIQKMGQLSESVRKAVVERADKAFDELDKAIDKSREGR